VLRVERLTKLYPGRRQPAIQEIDLEVRDGEILGLVGLNGAGKTTTIRVAAGVSLPSGGHVFVDGRDIVSEKRRASERLGWVPELFPYEPQAKAAALLRYYAGLQGIVGVPARRLASELLARVGLAPVENGRLATYSQGMKKRFALATAMIGDPPNLLLDEILNGLDPAGIAFVRQWVVDQRRQGKAQLLSSHLLGELEAIADRIAFVHQGRLLRTIDRAGLAQAGGTTLRLTLEKVDDAAVTYLGGLGTLRVEGNTIFVDRPSADPATVNAELVKRGYRVLELRLEATSLERYFLTLIQAGQ
jgi:ABC-2 type transport system ATP-binding protein